MKILITGGAGYIGSTTAEHLVRSGHEVVVIDNLSHGYRGALPEKIVFVEADIADEDAVLSVLENGVQAVLHFAASIEAGESMIEPGKYFYNNSIKTQRLIDTTIKAGVNNFVFSSTAAVYQSQSQPIAETSPVGPENVYGESKKISEDMLSWYSQTKGLNVGILRYFNAAGASVLINPPIRGGGLEGATHILPNILKVPLGMADKFVIFGNDYPTKDGTCVRDYIHVDDLARAHELALVGLLENKFQFEIFNLGNGNGFSNLHVLNMAREVTGDEIPSEFGDRREGDAVILIADSAKAQSVLDWNPKHPDLETIVRSAWDWHRTHPNGYEE